MAPDANPSPNNPAGNPPTEADFGAPSESEILDVFELGGNDAPAVDPQPAAASPAASEAGEGGSAAPAPSPDTPPEGTSPPKPAAAEPAPAKPSGAEAPPSAAPTTPPAAQPALDEGALKTASLEAQLDALQQELATLRAGKTEGTPTGAPTPTESGEPKEPPTVPSRYALTLPKPITDALLSDNPEHNVAAIQAVINDLGTLVHHNVVLQMRKEMQGSIGGLLTEAQNAVSGTERQSAAEAAREDYYKAFPDHKNPLVLPIIQSEAQKMAAEFPKLPWSADYINALGVRVQNAIATISGQPPQPVGDQPPVNPASTPPARPAAMLPAGNRGASAVTASGDVADEIMGVLSPF